MSKKFRYGFIAVALLGLVSLGMTRWQAVAESGLLSNHQTGCKLVVLARPDDSYYPLAEEIATAENAFVAHTLEDALACRPAYLLWVASPGSLSEASLIEFGLAMKEQSSALSSGLITASTLDQARALWERRSKVQNQSFFIVNAANPAAHIDKGRIMTPDHGLARPQLLTKESFISALAAADYLTFTGHGGGGHLKLDENSSLTAADIPPLQAAVVATGSCQTLQPWREDSIARRFVDRGAAAYSGFVFSPNEGYLFGEFNGLPFRYTWPDFPIGHVIQVQNRGTLQGFAHFPYQYLLGDPRTALQTRPPYHMTGNHPAGNWRTITFQDVPSGVIPIRVADGAAYRFVQAPGITAAAEQDPFYNSRLQMTNIREDKFLLLVHTGGDLTLRMRRQAPWYWFPTDILLDSLDDVFIFRPQSGGDRIAIIFAAIPLIWSGWQVFRKRLSRQMLRVALAVGVAAASLQGIYVLLRLDQVTITSKTVEFSPLSLIAGFLLNACGTLISFHARRPVGKATALLVMTFISWSPMAFELSVVAIFNLFFFIPAAGTPLYSYVPGLLPAGSLVCNLLLASLVVRFASRMLRST